MGIFRVNGRWAVRCAHCGAVLEHDSAPGVLVKLGLHLAWHYGRDPAVRAAIELGVERLCGELEVARGLAGIAAASAGVAVWIGAMPRAVAEKALGVETELARIAVAIEKPGMAVEIGPA